MIFGYYTIPLKTLKRQELPSNLQVEPGVEIQMGMKVAHVIFIPFFPLGKNWIMKKGGQSYSLTPQAEKMFDQTYGRPKTPFYAFLGPIILVLGFIYMNVQDGMKSRAREKSYNTSYTKKANAKIDKIKQATTNDYLAFKVSRGKTYSAKVERVIPDSLVLRFAPNDKGASSTNKNNVLKNFILDRLKFEQITVAKTDLINTISTDRHNLTDNKIIIAGLASGMPLIVDEVYRVDEDDFTGLNIKDNTTTAEVKSTISRFVNNMSIDTSLTLLDQASKDYFMEVLSLAKTRDEQRMKSYIKASKYPSVDYAMMLYTNYSYLSSTEKDSPKSTEDLLRTYGFYTKLIGLGLWSIEDNLKETVVSGVYLTSKNHAKAKLRLRANILETTTQYGNVPVGGGTVSREIIYFNIQLVRENGGWKINLPSTWSYTENQIAKVRDSKGRFSNNGPRDYRQMIRDQIKTLGHEITADSPLNY